MAQQLNTMLCLIFSLSLQANTFIEDMGRSVYAFLDSKDSERLHKSLKSGAEFYETADQRVGIFCSLPKERDKGSALCYVVLKIAKSGVTPVNRDEYEDMVVADLGAADSSNLFRTLDFSARVTRYGKEKYFCSKDMRFSLNCHQERHVPFPVSAPRCSIYLRL